MQYRNLGRSGLRVSEIALGSWLTFGSAVEREETAKIIRRAFDLGVNFFDTADVYAKGAAEKFLGGALTGVRREELVIGTKVFGCWTDINGWLNTVL